MNTVSLQSMSVNPAFGSLFDRLFGKKKKAEPPTGQAAETATYVNGLARAYRKGQAPVVNKGAGKETRSGGTGGTAPHSVVVTEPQPALKTPPPVIAAAPTGTLGVMLGADFETLLHAKLEAFQIAKEDKLKPAALKAVQAIGFKSDPWIKSDRGSEKSARVLAGELLPLGLYTGYKKKPGIPPIDVSDYASFHPDVDYIKIVVSAKSIEGEFVKPDGREPKMFAVYFGFQKDATPLIMGMQATDKMPASKGGTLGSQGLLVLPAEDQWYPLTLAVLSKGKAPKLFGAVKAYGEWMRDNINDPKRVGVYTWPDPKTYSMTSYGEEKISPVARK